MKHQIVQTHPISIKKCDLGIPIGNGKLGALLCGGVQCDYINLNEETIWYGGPLNRENKDASKQIPRIRELLLKGEVEKATSLVKTGFNPTPKYLNPYEPAGDIRIEFANHKGVVQDYKNILDIDNGIAEMTYKLNGASYRREYLASLDEKVIAIRISGDEPISLKANLNRRPFEEYTGRISDNTVALWGQCGAGGVNYYVSARIDTKGGKSYTMGDYIIAEDAKEVYIYITSFTDFHNNGDLKNQCLEVFDRVEAQGFDEIEKKHQSIFKSLYDRCSLSLNDEDFEGDTESLVKAAKEGDKKAQLILSENMFALGRYLMISSSYNCILPTTLQGIWNGNFTPAWECKFTVNINEEMNYWPAEKCNLSECHSPLFDFVDRMVERGATTAKVMYNCNGSVAHHNTNIWADTAPEGILDSSPVWPMSLPWLSLHFYEHYLYTLDEKFLRERAIPVMEQCILFYSEYLYKDEDGTLLTGPSLSPENTYITDDGQEGSICMSPTMDNQILREMCYAYLDALKKLDLHTEYEEKAQNIYKHLPQTKISHDGRIIEWNHEYKEKAPGHRHMSHLFGLYPARQITRDTPELFKAADKTIDYRLSHGGGHTGWSSAWILNMYARLGRGDKTDITIKKFLENSVQPNMFDICPPFQIDGNFGYTAGAVECIIQSHNGEIELLPALPVSWTNGSLKGVKLRGNITCDISWEDGKLKDYKLTSPVRQRIRVRYDDSLETKEL